MGWEGRRCLLGRDPHRRIYAVSGRPVLNGLHMQDIDAEFHALVQSLRVGVLITTGPEGPFGSHVPFLMTGDWTRVFIHISRLAVHTKNLMQDRRLALFLAEPDRTEKNPAALKRINLQGSAHPLADDAQGYGEIKENYLSRFPQ